MNLTIREYSFFALTLLATVWFFVAYPSQDPRTAIDISMDSETIEQKAVDALELWGYSIQNYDVYTRFGTDRWLLDSLQTSLGRSQIVRQLRENEIPNIEPFFWRVEFRPPSDQNDQEPDGPGNQHDLEIQIDQKGKLLNFDNHGNVMPLRKINRSAIANIFESAQDSAVSLLNTYSDTMLTRRVQIELQRNLAQLEKHQSGQLSHLAEVMQHQGVYELSKEDIYKIALFYLDDTGWDMSGFTPDTVQLNRINSTNIATARFSLTEPKLDQDLSLEVDVTATGGLLGINSIYNDRTRDVGGPPGLWGFVQQALIVLFVLGGVVLFFFRIRARAIDTQPALIVSILSGLSVSMLVVLFLVERVAFFEQWSQSIELLIASGLAGAAASLAFFVFFSIGDSIVRQHWPEKLSMYDYLRQGMVFNKPIGFMLVRSVMLALILAGIWTFLLWLIPEFYFDIRNVFIADMAAWPPIFLLLANGLYSLSIVLGIFLVLGGQSFAQFKNKYITSGLMVLACGIAIPFTGNYGPLLYEFGIAAAIGLAMVLIYLKWDFLTLLISHFLFLGLMETTTGWIVAGSFDTYIFVALLLLMSLLLIGGLVAITKGKEENVLTRYVPEYVEELAQEERIKQELQIAREVQQSFLPVRTPQFDKLELAAICKPAYETGGDYYDFVQLDDHRVAVTIGDVSGKGIQAAFYMTFVKGVLHSLCREIDSPAEILKKTNRLFWENAPRGTFISLVYGIIDLKDLTFHFARAGHNPIIRMNVENDSVEELQPKGIGIGLTKDQSFDNNIEEISLELTGDDVLILYTDGIVEALNENQKFYGTHRLNNLLKKNKDISAAEMIEQLSEDVRSFIGSAKQHDDMTMLIMKLRH